MRYIRYDERTMVGKGTVCKENDGDQGLSPGEVKLVEQTIEERFIKEKPKRIIDDLAYDSDHLDGRLKKKRIRLIAPHKHNRKKKIIQDGRELRRDCRRWKVERFFSWLQNSDDA